ncbi:MAG: CvpA family protein [Candidatus Brocadiia bacterium]
MLGGTELAPNREAMAMSSLAQAAAGKLLGVFTVLDLVVLALVLISLAFGYWTGFVWQIIRLSGSLVALWLAWYYHPVVARQLAGVLSSSVRHIGSAAVVFVGTLLLFYLLFYLVRKPINAMKPERPDRVLGAVLGLVKGALIVGLAALVVLRYAEQESRLRECVESSRVASALSTCAEGLVSLVPPAESEQPQEGEADVPAG